MRELKITASITNRESASFVKYLQEISKTELIPVEEEVRLTNLVKQGDKAALDRLVKANLRFVVSVAKQYQNTGLSLPDLVNEGNIGLMRAAKSFDDTKGFKFISYAVWWIRQSILNAIGENALMVRIPTNKRILKNKVRKAHEALEQELDRIPHTEELAEALGMDADEVDEALQLHGDHVSIDAPIGEDEEGSFLDLIIDSQAKSTDEKINHRESLVRELGRSMETLDKRQKQMLCLLYGIGIEYPLSLEDIGRKYDLTRERVRQIRDKALIKLRAGKNADHLKTFLGR
jgi:RNA polymerase primary sigma factor